MSCPSSLLPSRLRRHKAKRRVEMHQRVPCAEELKEFCGDLSTYYVAVDSDDSVAAMLPALSSAHIRAHQHSRSHEHGESVCIVYDTGYYEEAKSQLVLVTAVRGT